jgi:glucose/arabinose dehydrogenase
MYYNKTFRVRAKFAAVIAMLATLVSACGSADANGGNLATATSAATSSFLIRPVAEFRTPWALAFLPDGRMLVTEEGGRLFLVSPDGAKTDVRNVPTVDTSGGDGLLDIAPGPDFARSQQVFFSYVESGRRLVLARAPLLLSKDGAALGTPVVLWRQNVAGGGTHTGGVIAFNPTGSHVFLTVGDFHEPDSVQDPQQARGKVLRLLLDGSVPADNPQSAAGGVQAQTWTTGHRNPYGLAFSADGRLWLHEMGPRGGDEFNLVERGRNYGWPIVSEGTQYSGAPIPPHASRAEFAAPLAHWTPVISPAGMVFYDGTMFPQWRGSALIGGLSSRGLLRVGFGTDGKPFAAENWDMGARIRDVAIASDGAIWVIEDSERGRLLRLAKRP